MLLLEIFAGLYEEGEASARDIPTNAYCERSFLEVSPFYYGHLAAQVRTWPVQDLVGVAMVAAGVVVAMATMLVRVSRHC